MDGRARKDKTETTKRQQRQQEKQSVRKRRKEENKIAQEGKKTALIIKEKRTRHEKVKTMFLKMQEGIEMLKQTEHFFWLIPLEIKALGKEKGRCK